MGNVCKYGTYLIQVFADKNLLTWDYDNALKIAKVHVQKRT